MSNKNSKKIDFEELIQNSRDGIIAVDSQGKIIFGNEVSKEIFNKDKIVGEEFGFPCQESEMAEVKIPCRGKDKVKFAEMQVSEATINNETVYIVNIRDISKRKLAEKKLEKYQEKLFQNERLVSLGRMAGGMAHEINNPLSNIIMTIQLMMEEDGPPKKNDLKIIVENADRIKTTVKGFMGFSKDRNYIYRKENINRIVEKSLQMIGAKSKKGVSIIKDFDKNISTVMTSRFHLEEVFNNLIINALYSLEGEEKRELTIKTYRKKENIYVSFKDTGKGIEKENLNKIFKPYYTTKGKKGTGLGLPTCRKILNKLGGNIEVKSKGEDRGAEFIIELPLKGEKDGET